MSSDLYMILEIYTIKKLFIPNIFCIKELISVPNYTMSCVL